MKNRNTYFTVAFVLVILTIIFVWIYFFHPKPEQPHIEMGRKRGGPCPGETKTFVMNDLHMRGLLEPGEKYKVIFNYYDCNPISRNDLVYYQFSTALPPIVRVARGVAGDKFTLKPDGVHHAWNLFINGEIIKSEIANHDPYFFGAETPTTLGLSLDSRKDGLFSDDVIVLSSYPPGDNDSGVFGLAKYVDILGKVVKIESSKKSD